MQESGKRLLLAVGLALVVMFAWQTFLAPKDEPKKPEPAATTTGSGSAVAPGTTPTVPGTATQPTTPVAPMKLGPEQEIKLSHPKFEATFSNHGGVLKAWHLSDKRYDRDKNKGDLLPKLPNTGAFGVSFPNSTYLLPPQTEWVGTKI